MAKYTTTLKMVAENHYLTTHPDVDFYDPYQARPKRKDVINNALPIIFDFDFPIYDETYRSHLEYLIVNHHYMDEIAYETFEMWKWQCEIWLNENMQYYNTLYEAGKTMGNIFEVNSWRKDKYDSDDVHTYNKETDITVKNTGTQKNGGTSSNTGSVTNRVDEWQTNSDIADGNNYKSPTNISTANHSMTDGEGNVRTDDLVRKDDFTRTDDLKRVDEHREKDVDSIVDDQTRVIESKDDVPDKIETFQKLAEYYVSVDKEIVEAMSCLFMGLW